MIPSQRGFRVARGCRWGSAKSGEIRRRILARAFPSLAFTLGIPLFSLAPSGAAEDSLTLPAADDLRLSEAGQNKSQALGLYYKGLMLEASLKIPEQIACYQEVLRLDPENPALAMETANLCAAYGRFDEARELLEENLALNPSDPGAYLNLSRFCDTYANGDPAMAERALVLANEALRTFPQDPDVCHYLTGLLLERGKKDEAREAFERTMALAGPVTDSSFWLRMAGIARKLLSNERARVNALYNKSLMLSDGDLEISKTVGDYFSTTRQYTEAGKIYEDIVAAHPDALDVRERLVHVLRTQGEKERALAVLEALVAIDPVNENTRQLLAEFYQAGGENAKAIAEFEQILRMKDGNIEDYEQLADQMIEAELLEGAELLLVRARLRFPDSTILSHKLAIVLSYLDRPTEALAQWDQTAELAERHGDAILSSDFYHYYGAAADAAKEYDRAADYFRKAIALVRESGDETGAAISLNDLGYMWLEQNINIEAAGELIQRAIALEPEIPDYIDSLGWFHFRRGRFDEALESLLQAEKLLQTPDPVVLDHIGQTYHELGKNEDAVRYFQRALELAPENAEIQARIKTIKAQSAPVSTPAESSPAAAEAAASTPPKEKAA
jgi:tetratricopeptide (TPR) repeat protein